MYAGFDRFCHGYTTGTNFLAHTHTHEHHTHYHQEIVEALVFPVRSYHVVDPWDCVFNV